MSDEAKKHFERPTMYKQDFPSVRRTLYLLGVVGVALFSGALGFMLMTLYFFPTGTPVITPISGPTGSLISDPFTLPVRFDSRSVSLGVLTRATSYRTGNEAYDTLIDPAVIEGVYAAMTSDGWFVGYGDINASTGLLMTIAGVSVPVEEVRRDAQSDLVFLKVNASTSPITVSDDHPVTGQRIVSPVFESVVSHPTILALVGRTFNSSGASKADFIQSTDSYSNYVELLQAEQVEEGQLFFDQGQKLVGLALGNGLLPGWEIKNAFDRVLRTDREPLILGASYTENYKPFSLDTGEGATFFNPNQNAVPLGSLARQSGLVAGDRVIAVNGEALSTTAPFRKLWTNAQFNDRISLNVVRDGEELQLVIQR